MNGATEPVVASHGIHFSTLRTSSAEATCMATATAFWLLSFPRCGFAVASWLSTSFIPAAYTLARGELETCAATIFGAAELRLARKALRNWAVSE